MPLKTSKGWVNDLTSPVTGAENSQLTLKPKKVLQQFRTISF
ncbi:hypothetical protein MGMO_138c00090 [Methyloglobulus morosus KoM1]|uniref:Uncharacterized protein n=1 Tax=Methyloglobulus morosus KoM1 TaxID=1116472 RepID=V5DP18_9GAMM|nr:hypothetical protein MGMO_138c00090 [Methyloglobulus morosus KoM1]